MKMASHLGAEEGLMSRKEELIKRIAYLEFVNDQLQTELRYVDHLLKSIGFPRGLDTVKVAAAEMHGLEYPEHQELKPWEEDEALPD